MPPTDARAFTFDCYGTLIDWEAGIRAALVALPALAGIDHDAFLTERETAELKIEAGPFRPYDEVLALSLQRAAERFGLAVGDGDARRFAATLPDWPAHADTAPFLRRLRQLRRPLAVLSNVTTPWLRLSLRQFPLPFDRLVTADDVRAYKPAPRHWLAALSALALEPAGLLHVAASLRHDIYPAIQLGIPVAWVNRHDEALPPDLTPAVVVRDLRELAQALHLPPER